MIRVLRLIPTIDPTVGGPSHSAVNAAIAESDEAIRTVLVTTIDPNSPGELSPAHARLDDAGVPIIAFPRTRWLGRRAGTWGLSLRLVVWVLRHVSQFDILHLHYVWSLPTIVGAMCARFSGVPVVLTGHESLTNYDINITSGSRFKQRAKLAFRRLLMAQVSTVICASELELRDSLRTGEQGVVIAHPVVKEVGSHSTARQRDEFTLGFLGRLHPKKGVERLLRAFSRLDCESKLIICGDGDTEFVTQLHNLSNDLDLGDRVDWRGHVGQSGKQKFFETIDWVAMPSDYECFGMAGAEALAAGVPAIVSAETGIAPIVREFDCGIVVDLANKDALYDALTEASALDDQSSLELGQHALHASRESLTFSAYRRNIKEQYDLVARTKHVVPVELS